MRLPRLSPATYRRITLVAVIALGFIIVTGGAVRLTGSGLGCPDWPTCAHDRVVAPWEYHAMVEFVNRTITGLVSVAVILAVLGSLVRRPRRRDLVWLSAGLVAGVVGQIVLGGLTVLFHLAPPLVMSHFLLSMVILADAVVLHHRAGDPDDGIARPVVSRDLRRLGGLVVASAALTIFLGTVLTGSGPHGGDEDVERLPFFVPDVARVHGVSVMIFLGLVLVTLWRLRRDGAPAGLLRRGEVLLAVLVAQAAVGYVQYFTGVPVLLVGVHILGATLVWAAVIRFFLGFSTREVVARPAVAASGEGQPSELLPST
ncbi:MAG TPA: COX15/CtaA family protein [Acidimicrobiales bacterium]|nr:COX15/CtaA family protein [Acidimicrobiales bacterium]